MRLYTSKGDLKTRFQLILPVDSHNVTKNRTGHVMHVEGPQIFCCKSIYNRSWSPKWGIYKGVHRMFDLFGVFSPYLVDPVDIGHPKYW